MKIKFFLIVFLISIILPFNAKAMYCTYTDQADLRKKASNVSYSYDYTENGDSVLFSITFTNITDELYVFDSNNKIRYDYNGTNEITIYGYKPGSNNSFKVYATDSNCIKDYLSTKYIKLPGYNKYYKDEICKGIEKYSICYKWQANNLSYNEFIEKAKQYKKIEDIKNDKSEQTFSRTLFDEIFDFMIKNYMYILFGVMIIILPISFFLNRHNNDFDL